jgi:hypothetical protein
VALDSAHGFQGPVNPVDLLLLGDQVQLTGDDR